MATICGGFPGLEAGDEVRVGEFVMRVAAVRLDVEREALDVSVFGGAGKAYAAGPTRARFEIEGYDLRRAPVEASAVAVEAAGVPPDGARRLVRWGPR